MNFLEGGGLGILRRNERRRGDNIQLVECNR